MEGSKKGKKLGVFIKDTFPGPFCEAWKKALKAKEFENVDIGASIAYIMSNKEEPEINIIRKASLVSVDLFNKYLKEQIMDIIDSDKKVKHSKLAEGVESASADKKYVSGVDMSQLDMCYPPIIQSGGHYSLKFSAVSDKEYLHFGAIVCSLGARYKNYCSNISRTLLVNPTDIISENYTFLVSVEDEILKLLKPGAKLNEVYNTVVDFVKAGKPKLVDNLTKTFGTVMGIEFRENSINIGPKCQAVVKKGMIFNVNLGFSNLTNSEATGKEGKTYALFIGDTVIVNDEPPASIMTPSKKKIKNIGICIKDDEEEEDEKEENNHSENNTELLGRSKRNTVLENKLRNETSTEEKRKQHQKELAQLVNEKAKERLAKQGGSKETEKVRKNTVSYKGLSQMPRESEVKELKLYVGKFVA